MLINDSKNLILGRLNAHNVIVMKLKNGPGTDDNQRLIRKLEESDMMVRAHEQAHLLAAGGNALGEPTYRKVIGPDGKAYAVAGEVKIDLSPVEGDPVATRRKARLLRNAALAPSGPSGADIAALDYIDDLARSVKEKTVLRGHRENPYHAAGISHERLINKPVFDYYA